MLNEHLLSQQVAYSNCLTGNQYWQTKHTQIGFQRSHLINYIYENTLWRHLAVLGGNARRHGNRALIGHFDTLLTRQNAVTAANSHSNLYLTLSIPSLNFN